MKKYYFFPCCLFGGGKEGVLPGVSLLSLWRLSGLPVDSAILFGPGFSAIILKFIYKVCLLIAAYF